MRADEAFLAEIVSDPDNDEPRLIYADWLQARNEVRADFIRLQCEVAQLTAHSPARAKLVAQSKQLGAQFERIWSAPLRGLTSGVEFRRGFVEHIAVDVEGFLKHRERLCRQAPIRSIEFRTDGESPLKDLAKCRELQQIQELAFVGEPVGLSHLLQAESMSSTRSLRLAPGSISLKTLDSLAAAPAIPELTRLDIRQTLLPATAVGELLAYPVFEHLAELRMGPLPLTDTPYPIALELSPILNRLQSLELSMCQLAAADLRELFHYCTSPATDRLALARNPLGWQGVRALREAPFVGNLIELDLSSCQLNARGMATLAALPIRHLRSLRLNHNLLDHRGARELANAESLAGLLELHLRGTQSRVRQGTFSLGDAGVSSLLANGLRSLRYLDLAGNRLRCASVTTLLACPELDQLAVLDLSNNELDERAAENLLERGPWRDLVRLKLDNNALGQDASRRLRSVFGTRVSV